MLNVVEMSAGVASDEMMAWWSAGRAVTIPATSRIVRFVPAGVLPAAYMLGILLLLYGLIKSEGIIPDATTFGGENRMSGHGRFIAAISDSSNPDGKPSTSLKTRPSVKGVPIGLTIGKRISAIVLRGAFGTSRRLFAVRELKMLPCAIGGNAIGI